MDEDYDACDLENWFLAIQSADGQVMIPSFHRPGILAKDDWTVPAYDSNGNSINTTIRSKILRPRQIDNSPLFPYDPSSLDSKGKLTYDIDNDGDGVTDSVWLDLGFPAQRDPNGKLYKPLFAFMVLGLNGRMPLNTVGNLQARAVGDTTHNTDDSVPYTASSGQVPYAGPYTQSGYHNPLYSSQVFFDTPLYDHASHNGYSVNEINPKFALQNAPSNLYGTSDANANSWAQYDNAGVSVALTQLRNILAGGRPTITAYNSTDTNTVVVNSVAESLPNGLYDLLDSNKPNDTSTTNLAAAVAGRWGEPGGIPSSYPTPLHVNTFDTSYPMYWYTNPVRAGRSIGGTDATDDDFDGFDPHLPVTTTLASSNQSATFTLVETQVTGTPDQIPLNSTSAYAGPTFTRQHPEDLDSFDNAGQMAVATERVRRFVTPRDTAGIGRMVPLIPSSNTSTTRPAKDYDYGYGADDKGRVGYFRYFRPAGLPQEIRYPYIDTGSTQDSVSHFEYPYKTNSGLGQRYLMPVLLPAGRSTATSLTAYATSADDVTNNKLHSFQAALTPKVVTGANGLSAQTIATLAAMPFDWDPFLNTYAGGTPGGYNDTQLEATGLKLQLFSPTINPYTTSLASGGNNPAVSPVLSSVNTFNGPNLGTIGDPAAGPIQYPLPYGATYQAVTETGGGGTANNEQALGAPVVNGYLDGGLNKDEADEMNLYAAGMFDMPYGPTDLEWLYRKHDVDGATLSSRLAQLAPISFLNSVDGLTRRRLFSTDSWELNRFAWANDNPPPYAGVLGNLNGAVGASTYHTPDHDFSYNSRFMRDASPSLELMNQIVSVDNTLATFNQFANPFTTEFLPNPTFPVLTTAGGLLGAPIPNSSYNATSAANSYAMPRLLTPGATDLFSTNALTNAQVDNYTNVIKPFGGMTGTTPISPLSQAQVQTPSVAHLDRKINLNFPLPISNDPAEPIRQKWCRETYQMLKAILPPASIDTPEELAALSQFVVNIIDFRDPDCTMTRFVNTDLEVTDVLTKQAHNTQIDPNTNIFDPTWTVSPAGVRFAQNALTTGHAPYDPSIYSPDRVSPYLVQHGMEYNPIAINEVMSYQAQYGASSSATSLTPYQTLFIELMNTATNAQNGNSTNNSSAVSLLGWDIVVMPDNYGWGRPDPISGDVNTVAIPPYTPNPGGSITADPDPLPTVTDTADAGNVTNLRALVSRFTVDSTFTNTTIQGFSGNSPPNVFVMGDYRTNGTNGVGGTSVDPSGATGGTGKVETTPVVTSNNINLKLPIAFNFPNVPSGKAMYYWVYLRRPANPFDIDKPNQVRPNKEMVVVDAMRFPAINAANSTLTGSGATATITASPNAIYSAQRLQPFRGGHLLRVDTDPTPPTGVNGTAIPSTTPPPTGPPAGGVKDICPPSPPYAYGYSEQMATPPSGSATALYPKDTNTNTPTTLVFQNSINATNSGADTNWAQFPFHDRDFASVAELLLVPGCPPGLFTKQFVEESYPGNIYIQKYGTPLYSALGTDNRDFGVNNTPSTPLYAPTGGPTTVPSPLPTNTAPDPTVATSKDAPSLVGRKNFNAPIAGTLVASRPTFPYLSDNFYYTAASVNPPAASGVATAYTHLTTEIGGWTGAGWHKMLEFFDVPSSANGAIGTADNGDNYDWYRADVSPGRLNLNLIIDDEVFAGLIDDPRLNDNIAHASSSIPHVVNQVDPTNNFFPVSSGGNYGTPMFPDTSQSYLIVNGTGGLYTAGRGYAYRDPNLADYSPLVAGSYNYQQVHGLKAAFSDFLKLRSGGSGFLFAHGPGDVGMGTLVLPIGSPATPVAADRPFRSPSYPDINYTIMRPASLPPSPANSSGTINSPGTNPPLPIVGSPGYPTPTGTLTAGLATLFTYNTLASEPYVQFNQLLAPMNEANHQRYQYVQDPGIKNPYLPVQYTNTTSPTDVQPASTDTPSYVPLSKRRLAPPYDTNLRQMTGPTPGTHIAIPVAAPFPPTIPPVPARRLFQIPDDTPADTNRATSNASLLGAFDNSATALANINQYPINQPTVAPALTTGSTSPPSMVTQYRAVFAADNYTPQSALPADSVQANNFLGAGSAGVTPTASPFDNRQHPAFQTEWLQKISNLTTVRTHQFATWITVGFFEVVKVGTPELGIPDVLGQEMGAAAGTNVRYRSFFVIDRTNATGFNPYYPGNFRDCVTFRRRIE